MNLQSEILFFTELDPVGRRGCWHCWCMS